MVRLKEIGSIVAKWDSPSSSQFSFVVTANGSVPVRRGQFVELETEEGKVIAFVTNVIKTNRYFMRAESVREYERGGRALTSIFPADRWEYIVADALALGIEGKEGLDRVSFPASPGQKVYEACQETLTKFLGFDQNDGVELGSLRYHGLPVKLNLTKLLRKHVAILAKSGAGKSYGASVIIEELLDRLEEQGRVASIVVDVHGEYTSLAMSSGNVDYSDRTSIVKGKSIRIGVPNLSAYRFREFIPEMTGIQLRELGRILEGLRVEMRSGKGSFDLDEVIERVEEDERIRGSTKEALLGWLFELRELGIFGKTDYPSWEELVEPGKAVLLDLSDTINLRRKQVIVAYVARKLFKLRKRGRVPPFVLFLEEAHQFCPSTESRGVAISRSVIELIAREGRKFYASLVLISQRPVRLSTTVLSQANTNIILRVTNPYDLDHIKRSSECITSETAEMISSLPVGEALVVGEAVNHPIFVRIRRRRSQEAAHGASLEEVAKNFEQQRNRSSEDAKAFM